MIKLEGKYNHPPLLPPRDELPLETLPEDLDEPEDEPLLYDLLLEGEDLLYDLELFLLTDELELFTLLLLVLRFLAV